MIGEIRKIEIPHRGNVYWPVPLPYQETYYKVEMKAHNSMGFSDEDIIIIRSGHGQYSFEVHGISQDL